MLIKQDAPLLVLKRKEGSRSQRMHRLQLEQQLETVSELILSSSLERSVVWPTPLFWPSEIDFASLTPRTVKEYTCVV